MVGQTGEKVTKYGQSYQAKGTQMVENGEEGKFGKSQRPKKKIAILTQLYTETAKPC